MSRIVSTFAGVSLILLLGTAQVLEAADYSKPGKGPLKVFILAGQSNMQGHGKSEHIKMAAADEKTRKEFAPLMNGEDYVVRKDVWVVYGNRQGGLSVGYGAGGDKIGPELGFGWHIGELLDEQVLLIKTCWGGHSLKEHFLPPSAGGPGESYTKMVSEVNNALKNLKTDFPDYDEKLGYEIVGLVWFQAWNDMLDNSQYNEKPSYKSYTERQGALLRDLRKEFKVPEMLMVIGEMGMEGSTHKKHVAFRKAQEAMTLEDEFKKTTRSVKTVQLWDPDPLFTSHRGFHYNGNGKIYYFIGKAMALAMSEMLPSTTVAAPPPS